MANKYEGNYDYTKPWRAPVQPDQVAKRWQYNGPWASNAERLQQQALMVATIPGAELSQMVRPPLPQIKLFPDKYGYDRNPIGIDDIVTIDRNYTEPRISWYSGGVAGYTGASRNTLGSQ